MAEPVEGKSPLELLKFPLETETDEARGHARSSAQATTARASRRCVMCATCGGRRTWAEKRLLFPPWGGWSWKVAATNYNTRQRK